MYKRFKPNYSLWPEQARPRRGWPLKFAVGSFMLGVACATASGFFFTSSSPASGQGPAKQAIVERGPIYASAVTPAATPAPAQIETENRGSRTRAAAKTKLPIIGSQTAQPIGGTDGRGSDVLAGGPPAAGSAASASQPPSLAREESKPARDMPALEARSEEAEPITITEPRAEPRTNVFRKKREESTSLAGAAGEPAREPPAREPKSAEAEPATATVRAEPRKSVRQEREQPTTSLVRESEPAREPPVRAARSEEAKTAAATERPASVRKSVVLKKSERPTRLVREESEPARKPPTREARSEEAKPATATERRSNPRKNIVREKREEPTNYAARDRQKREEPTRHANRRRQELMITGAALQALRLVTGGQDWLGLQGGL